MVSPQLIMLIHNGAVMQRWNDHIRPFTGFTEFDKQAHKCFYAYVLARCQEDEAGGVDFNRLIDAFIFEFLHRTVITDIKPPIYYKLKSSMGNEINNWVLSQLAPYFTDFGREFFGNMKLYFSDPDYSKTERNICRFAHYLATKWEFDIIYPMNIGMYNIERTKAEVNDSLTKCDWFEGRKLIYQNPKIFDFLNLIGQLRFQQRWTATARIPQTSVMGHTLVVAVLSYLFSIELGACPKRCENNFFGGLFHDLPEVLTRDIISPVKNGVAGLDELLKDIEDNQMKDIIYPLIPASWASRIDYYTNDEFSSKIMLNGEVKHTTTDEISKKYNDDYLNPIDGKVIRCCDHLSAYMEAYLSIQNGVETAPLKKAIHTLCDKYKDTVVGGIDFGAYFKTFNPYLNPDFNPDVI